MLTKDEILCLERGLSELPLIRDHEGDHLSAYTWYPSFESCIEKLLEKAKQNLKQEQTMNGMEKIIVTLILSVFSLVGVLCMTTIITTNSTVQKAIENNVSTEQLLILKKG